MNRRFAALALLVSIPAAALLRPEMPEPAAIAFADGGDLAPTRAHKKAARELALHLERGHYRTQKIDDDLSERAFDRYLDFLDPRRAVFLQSDIAEFSRYEREFDDAVWEGKLEPPFEIFRRYLERLREQGEYLTRFLEQDLTAIDFEDGETLDLDRSDAPWPADRAELEHLWRTRAEGEVLSLVMAEREDGDVRSVLERRYASQLRFAERFSADDVFQLFLNAVAASFGPHTQYLGRKSADDFDIEMSLSVEGIGALLGNTGEYIQIQRVIPGGPADKSGLLEATDRIVSVAQGDEEPVDIIGWRTDEAADIIRGPAGSKIRLWILKESAPASSPPREIELTREAVSLEERAATSRVVEVKRDASVESATHRIGVIDLPDFYMDFEAYHNGDEDYRSTSRDVAREVVRLTAEGVEGIVLDLRGNGGGSLPEVVQLGGLFLGPRPIVQVRGVDPKAAPEVLKARTKQIYDGPLLVLVDRRSASASEIFAGAVQDYGRALVVGERTFGKGTVQGILPLSSGELFLTQAKFYRVTGASTQLRGVTPDLRFPDGLDEATYGEDSLEEPLPWDEIAPAVALVRTIDESERVTEARGELLGMLPTLARLHEERVPSDPEFQRIFERLTYFESIENGESVSIDRSVREAEQAEHEARLLEIENRYRAAIGKPAVATLEELNAQAGASARDDGASEEDGGEDGADGAGEPEPEDAPDSEAGDEADDADEADPFLLEAARILADYAALTRPR